MMKISPFSRAGPGFPTLLALLAAVACGQPDTPTAPFVDELEPSFTTVLGGRGDGPIIYVTNQGKYYDSIVTAALPQQGPFQQLFPPGTNPDWPAGGSLSTQYGPSDPGYVGGRWWLDANGNGEMDAGDAFFSCPLLGPGRESP
jgi:hypothetical protein